MGSREEEFGVTMVMNVSRVYDPRSLCISELQKRTKLGGFSFMLGIVSPVGPMKELQGMPNTKM